MDHSRRARCGKAAGSLPHAEHGGSWMLREAKGEDLIYAVGGCGGTCVLSYPGGRLVGTLDVGGYAFEDGDCSDKAGNVFITHEATIYEYRHGDSSPIATLGLPGNDAKGCAVDPVTGNLAAVFVGTDADVAIFNHAQGSPSLYVSHLESSDCGYDPSGDLFVDGYDGGQPGLSDLAYGSPGFIELAISYSVGSPGQVQWDGKYMTYESGSPGAAKVSRLSISKSAATVVGTTLLKSILNGAEASWIYDKVILVPYSNRATRVNKIGIWKYPRGGKSIDVLQKFGDPKAVIMSAVTLSVAPSH